MGLQQMQNQEMGFFLSTDHAKPRLKWTPQLHHRFAEAVNQLGGPDSYAFFLFISVPKSPSFSIDLCLKLLPFYVYEAEATPKGLMRTMGIPGLTLHHLKSHLQKYRLGKHQQSEYFRDSKHIAANYKDKLNNDIATGEEIKENMRLTQAIQLQMDVQRKLHEQIKIERHVQLRIEAQGKYFDKVLKSAHETLCTSLSAEVQQPYSTSRDEKHRFKGVECSNESSLTSLESSENEEIVSFSQDVPPRMLLLFDHQLENRVFGARKRSATMAFHGGCFEQTSRRRSESFDLNRKCDQSHHGLD